MLQILKQTPLFDQIASEDYQAVLGCVGARRAKYQKEEYILLNGDEIRTIGVVLRGSVRLLKEDIFGNRAILSTIQTGAVFGESFICGEHYSLTVSIQAVTTAEILFLSFDKVMHICPNACKFHNTLIKNMVTMIAHKNLMLMEKLEITIKHSLREKMLTYLSQLIQREGNNTVVSPLGRTDLADFLGVNRSALTRELNRMRDEGIISYHKNTYTVNKLEL